MPAKAALLNAVAAAAPAGARVLEVDCGLGHLSLRLARHHGFEMTGLDLDPAMMRAQANANRPGNGNHRRPSLLVGDVGELAFPDRSFDLVVSTAGLARAFYCQGSRHAGPGPSRPPPQSQDLTLYPQGYG